MYITIRHYNVTPNSADEVMKRAVEGFIPIISKSPGFSSYDMVNTGSDTVTTISMFDTQAGMDKSTELAASWVKENLSSFMTSPPLVMGGLVGGHKSAK
jgi:heme-degrading monooxygenase HmoA